VTPVQVSSPGHFNGSLSTSVTLTGVTANNHIVVAVSHGDLGGSSPTISVSDGQGSYSSDLVVNSGGAATSALFRLTAVNAGSHTITATASSGSPSNSEGAIVAFEVLPVAVDQTSTNGGNNATPSVAATSSLANISELAFAVIWHGALNSGGGTFPPTGGTGTYTEISGIKSDNADVNYQTLTSTAGAGANWGTLTFSSKWAALVAVYKPVAAAYVPYAPMALGGMVVQVCQ